MRLGNRTSNEFILGLNQRNDLIQKGFLDRMTDLTRMSETTVMMGDSTIVKQSTFEPKQVTDYFKGVNACLAGWSVQDVSVSNNEDIRRIFTKSGVMVGNYLISLHLSVQFHVLLYYKPVQRVLDCQKELADIVDLTKNREQQISDSSDQLVLNKLREMGCKDFDHQGLFEVLYENDELREKVYAEIEHSTDAELKEVADRKSMLFEELDSLLVETYQTAPVLIDDTRLVTGEEGCLCMIDLEFVKNRNREGLFDPRKIPDAVGHAITERLDELAGAIGA